VFKIKYEKEVMMLASLCWNGDTICCTSVRLGENYVRDGITYKIRLEMLEELSEYQKVAKKKFKVTRFTNAKSDVINLIGVNG
jgi:hypothetical protein